MTGIGAAVEPSLQDPAIAAAELKKLMPRVAKRKPERVVYEVGRARRWVFTGLFLLLLPFFASLGPMLFYRMSHGDWSGTVGLSLIAVCFFAIMFFVVTELLFSIRTKVVFKDAAVKLTVPAGKGPTPFFKYATHNLRYQDVDSVETYRELYGGALAPIILKGSRVLKKDGTEIPLGFVSEANVDPSLPFPEIAGMIADRANLEMKDCGCRRHRFRHRVLGLKSGDEMGTPIEDFNLDRLNRRHYVAITTLIAGVAALVALGIFLDIINSIG